MTRIVRWVAYTELLAGFFMIIDLGFKFFWPCGVTMGLSKGVFIALGMIGLVVGRGLLKDSGAGWLGSVLFQIFLMPYFSFGETLFHPGLGIFFPVGITVSKNQVISPFHEFSIGIDFIISLHSEKIQNVFAVNLIALFSLVVLFIHRLKSTKIRRPPM